MDNLKLFSITERIFLTLWVGGMWITGYMMAPLLFQYLDKQTAGNVAGHMFTAMSYVGLFCGVLLLAGIAYRYGQQSFRQWRSWLLVAMLILVCLGEFILQPMMAELKVTGMLEGSENHKKFSMLHGIAAVIFLINSIAGLVLVIKSGHEN
ncbi:MAG: DUF4149 domain-containing protein [Gammaproteobacteria bacterium]|nr:DUF4149 domain-containing protein [Gammaproteobacteria bacterium]MDH5593340.1 DUF4149 domain-containing protein [Gammaproteobacteria bacterium]MDH5613914.1 DUF4149 domain-containing protein [Gammaproteobacteria bacterium]